MLIPIQARDRVRIELAKFDDSVVVGIPEVETGIEGD